MSDPMSIARAYLETWNEIDGAKRQSLLKKYCADKATYLDPLISADVSEGISGLVGTVHQPFPGFRFTLGGSRTCFDTTDSKWCTSILTTPCRYSAQPH